MDLDKKFARRFTPAEGMTEEQVEQIAEHILLTYSEMLLFRINRSLRSLSFYPGKGNHNSRAGEVLLNIVFYAMRHGKTVEDLSVPFLKRLARYKSRDYVREEYARKKQMYGDELPRKRLRRRAPHRGNADYNPARHGHLIADAEIGVMDTCVPYEEREAFFRPMIHALRGKTERQIFEMHFLRKMQLVQIAQALGVSKSRVTMSLQGTKERRGSMAKIREKVEAGEFEESLGSKQQIYDTLLRMIPSGKTGINVGA